MYPLCRQGYVEHEELECLEESGPVGLVLLALDERLHQLVVSVLGGGKLVSLPV